MIQLYYLKTKGVLAEIEIIEVTSSNTTSTLNLVSILTFCFFIFAHNRLSANLEILFHCVEQHFAVKKRGNELVIFHELVNKILTILHASNTC